MLYAQFILSAKKKKPRHDAPPNTAVIALDHSIPSPFLGDDSIRGRPKRRVGFAHRAVNFSAFRKVRTNGTVAGGRATPFWPLFIQWLGVTRASDPVVPCGHRLSCCLTLSILVRKATVCYAATKKSPNMDLSARHRCHSCDWLRRGSENWGYPPTAALIFDLPA